MRERVTTIIVLGAIAVFVVLVVSSAVDRDIANGGRGPASTVERSAGDPAVLDLIRTTSDCDELQTMFERAADNNLRYRPGSSLFEATKAYMDAAHKQMAKVGCYR